MWMKICEIEGHGHENTIKTSQNVFRVGFAALAVPVRPVYHYPSS
jgi:hypothetical protein